jgi:hypothetical protein
MSNPGDVQQVPSAQGGAAVINAWNNAPTTALNINSGAERLIQNPGNTSGDIFSGGNVGQLYQQQHVPTKYKSHETQSVGLPARQIQDTPMHRPMNTMPFDTGDIGSIIPSSIENNYISSFAENIIYGTDDFMSPGRIAPRSNFLSALPMQGNSFMSEMSLDIGSHIVGDLSQPSRTRPKGSWINNIADSFTGSHHPTHDPGVLFSGVNLSPVGAADILNLKDRRWF